MVLNPHTDKNKQVADNRQYKLMDTMVFYLIYFGKGYEFARFHCSFKQYIDNKMIWTIRLFRNFDM